MRVMKRIAIPFTILVAVVSASLVLANEPSRSTYRVRVESRGPVSASLLGKLVVDGRAIDLGGSRTPLDLTFSDTAVISGSLRAADGHRTIKVLVFNHAYSETDPEARAVSRAVEFAWAQPGVGPRTIETPSVRSKD